MVIVVVAEEVEVEEADMRFVDSMEVKEVEAEAEAVSEVVAVKAEAVSVVLLASVALLAQNWHAKSATNLTRKERRSF